MIAASDVIRFVGKRTVLRSENNVSYAGIVTSIEILQGEQGVLLELDARSRFSVWCPLNFVKELILVPISD
jgi:hypothetical protein